MIVICIQIQVAGILLAILSRIHFSKYKDTGKEQVSLSEKLTGYLYEKLRTSAVVKAWRTELRKLYVVSPEMEERLVRKHVTQTLACSMLILFLSAGLTELLVWKNQSGHRDDKAVITRTDYAGEVKTEAIWLTMDDETCVYSLEINPREYTEEEFYKLAREQIGDVTCRILGDNTDLKHITCDLELPQEDEAGIFTYSWVSDNPQIISSYGAVHMEEVTDTAAVTLTLRISYLSYELEETIPLVVVKETRRESAAEKALESLRQLEQKTRTEETITLPKEYEGVRIGLEDLTGVQAKRCLLAGLVLAVLIVPLARLKMRDAGKKRDDTLRRQYPSFVNALWLLLGSGMTIQMGIRQVISGMGNDVLLKRELEYALHQIENGSEEAWVYEQLGRRLQVPEYYQLMQHLSQHIRMGTKDLRNLMETEAQTALKKRREFAKKQGEEASTKLLFPMVVLLAVVMLIIVYPAMAGF